MQNRCSARLIFPTGAENGTRTRDPDLGKVVLYQLSYFRVLALWLWAQMDSNHRSRRQQIYSLPHLATLEYAL